MYDMLHQVTQLAVANPRITFAVIAGCLLPVAFLWRLEYSLPDKMGATWMRLTLLFGSLFLGPLGCCLVWWSWSGVVPGLIGGLLSEGLRQAALYFLAKKFPGLTSIPSVQVKVDSDGSVGVKVGDDPTIMLNKAQVKVIADTTTPGELAKPGTIVEPK